MTKKTVVSCVVISVIMGCLSFFIVSAQGETFSDNQVEQIRGNCLTTKNSLTQLHANDALTRVNMGQIYESMYTKLMDKFNSRLSSNKLDNTDLVNSANEYSLALDKFRLDYISYEEQLSKTIAIDCTKQPIVFYEAVIGSRTKRSQVHEDIINLTQKIDLYQSYLDQFEVNFSANSGGGN